MTPVRTKYRFLGIYTAFARLHALLVLVMPRAQSIVPGNAQKFVRGAERTVLDVMVMRCVHASMTPGDRRAFLRACQDAYGLEHLGKNLHADLLRARS